MRLAAFGAFVNLEPGIDGLVHISEITDHYIKKVEGRRFLSDRKWTLWFWTSILKPKNQSQH